MDCIRKACFAITFLLLTPLMVNAAATLEQEPAEAQAQQEEAQKEADNAVHYLPMVSVFGSMMPVEVVKYPGSVSVLTADDLNTYTSVIETLERVPGVRTGDSLGISIYEEFSIRGYNENRLVIEMDGVPRQHDVGFTSSFRVDPTILKTVEVVKGSSSILHGGGAIGGVVSMTTKDPSDLLFWGDKPYALELNSRFETNNSFTQAITAAIKTDTLPVDFLVHFSYVNEGDLTMADGGSGEKYFGFNRDTVEYDSGTQNFFGKIGWDLAEGQRLEASLFHFDQQAVSGVSPSTNMHFDIGLPGYSYPTNFSLKQTDFVGTYEWDSPSSDLIDLELRAYHSRVRALRDYTGQVNKMYNSEVRYGGEVKNVASFTTGSAIKHSLVTGIEYNHRSDDYMFDRGPTLGGILSGAALGAPNDYADIGIYIQDDITFFDRFTLTLGGRYDHYSRDVENQGSASESRFSPRIGASVGVFDGIYALGNYSETFRAPTPFEVSGEGYLSTTYYDLANPDLKPETAKEFEFGIALDKSNLLTDDDNLFFKAMYFTGEVENLIVRTNRPELGPPPQIPGFPVTTYRQHLNVGNAEREGFEIEARYAIDSWIFEASYEHLELVDAATGKDITSYADKLRVGLAYTYDPWGLTVGADVDHWFAANPDPESAAGWWYTNGGADRIETTYYYPDKSFTQVNVMLSWKPTNLGYTFFNDNLELGLGINNLFDKQYIPADVLMGYTQTYVGTGRNIYATVKLTF